MQTDTLGLIGHHLLADLQELYVAALQRHTAV
jgi:hypothetical protein